jgi:hypothetical protein
MREGTASDGIQHQPATLATRQVLFDFIVEKLAKPRRRSHFSEGSSAGEVQADMLIGAS